MVAEEGNDGARKLYWDMEDATLVTVDDEAGRSDLSTTAEVAVVLW